MLESNQHVHFGYLLDFSIPNPINDRVKRGLKELLYLLRPEDTSGAMGFPETNRTHSTIKVVLWVAVAITLSLAIGQLT